MSLLMLIVVFSLIQGFDSQNGFGNLPDDTKPESYTLNVVPDFKRENASFVGQVDILIVVKTTTYMITLNSKNLALNGIRVTDENTNRNITVNSWSYAKDEEQVKILLDEHVLANRKYMISIRFKGLLRDDGNGFFKSYYTSISGKKK